MTSYKLPYLHRFSRSVLLANGVIKRERCSNRAVRPEQYYENPQCGAAWHAVALARRKRREMAIDG